MCREQNETKSDFNIANELCAKTKHVKHGMKNEKIRSENGEINMRLPKHQLIAEKLMKNKLRTSNLRKQ